MKRKLSILALLMAIAVAAIAIAIIASGSSSDMATAIDQPHRINQHSEAALAKRGGEADREETTFAQEDYDNRAYPQFNIDPAQEQAAASASHAVALRPNVKQNTWQQLGPVTPNVPGAANYTGRPTTDSGRVTALALAPDCNLASCRLFVGAAGGGVWVTNNALAARPTWQPSSTGISSNAIGSILLDPTDTTGRTLYVGTGEPNGSGDSEAGVGLFKSTDSGRTWSLVPGSVAVAQDRSIGAIAVDPINAMHLWIGTAVARHGSSSVNGGRFTPPNAPAVGLYESWDGGVSFTVVFTRTADPVDPTSATGSDFFRGGISRLEVDRLGLGATDPTRIYLSVFDYGLYRSTGPGTFEQVFASTGEGTSGESSFSRTEFALAPNGNQLRIYVGDAGSDGADFYRVDNANVPASTLTDGTDNPGWTKLSNSTAGTPGFSSFDYCDGQCTYDMPIAVRPGHPEEVWIGGSMQYNEIFTANPPSNGRAIQRSTDAGVSFTDMTNDTQSPPLGMHPDQHFITFVGGDSDVAFVGSDGGVVRTSGQYSDASSQCAGRGLSGTDLTDCQMWLAAIPTQITSLNDGLVTLQFQSLSLNVQNPLHDLIGGTQDNGTWVINNSGVGSWFESVGGDGGQSGIDIAQSNVRMHTYFSDQGDVNFHANNPLGWDWMADALLNSGEAASFYVPLINDPRTSGTWFVGLQHVWRTTDNAGQQASLDLHCNEFTGDFAITCGDWTPIGSDLTGSTFGSDKSGSYVVAIARTPTDAATMWAATRRGRLFVSKNVNAADASVVFTRIDTADQPTRFISGITIDPANPNHAVVSFSGYSAYSAGGHVYDVLFNPNSGTATWTDLSYNLGDQPITAIARDNQTGDLYAATDFGVDVLTTGSTTWMPAASNLPPVATYGLTLDTQARVLYAATHGRGIWRLDLSR